MSYGDAGGGTLTLSSPTHVHHVDVTSAVRSLQRSLSRSPSKFRLVTKSPSPSPQPAAAASPRHAATPAAAAQRRATPQPPFAVPATTTHTPSPLVPFPPSVKLSLRSATRHKSLTPTRPTRTSPRSTISRALSQSLDHGNATAISVAPPATGPENHAAISPARRSVDHKLTKHLSLIHDASHAMHHALSRRADGASDSHTPSITASPLKRSDAIMNLDQASRGSPVAKRRSLHGTATWGADFNVFDPAPAGQFDIHDDATPPPHTAGYELSGGPTTANAFAPDAPLFTPSVPRRSSSLRKSTLQQRHGDKSSWGRRHAAQQLSHLAGESTTQVKSRPRLSLDQFMPPAPRESPFQNGPLPLPSIHPVGTQPVAAAAATTTTTTTTTTQPHPLSRTMTTSSSSSSMDDSPTHFPPSFHQAPRPRLDFSKSLPLGATRPFAVAEDDAESFATPKNYKSVKPLPAAFMSTGLISKVNRNPEQLPEYRGKTNVPDTPCKKHFNNFATYPAAIPGSAMAKARHVRHSFGTPSPPFNPHGRTPAPGTFGKGTGPLGGVFAKGPTRRPSFLHLGFDGDDLDLLDPKGDSQLSGADFDLPPTPTKPAISPSPSPSPWHPPPPKSVLVAPSPALSAFGAAPPTKKSSKLNLFTVSCLDDDQDVSMDEEPSPSASGFRFVDAARVPPSFSRLRAIRGAPSPPALVVRPSSAFFSPSRKPGFAKVSHVAPASPLERIDFIERRSPHTPQDNITPPDPSSLSISATAHDQRPPATPTTGRDYFTKANDRRLSFTPVHHKTTELDANLTSRFDKVELVGTGEFSEVYRVATQPPSAAWSLGAPAALHSPGVDKVYAVKKTRHSYLGVKDRERKLREIDVLKVIGGSDHTIKLFDSWEDQNRLYIQTEYCEEGSLELFLSYIGRKGRLDDFRIWKVMLEIALGLKHIHDAGFVHLDLKPANIFITFEGVLKIGDFGMAAALPTAPGIEGEGDREYIGPEILLGQYDKPADIFALGLILLEIAGNVKLPDNGPTWQRLRSGDMSDVPSLTNSGSITVNENPRDRLKDFDHSVSMFYSDDDPESDPESTPFKLKRHSMPIFSPGAHDPGNLFGRPLGRGELLSPPVFMRDVTHTSALEAMVKWMISPAPAERPTAQQLLDCEGPQWVALRRRAGATVFEGPWGPADEVLTTDAEMIDV